MEATELRIDNWLNYNGKPFQVTLGFFTELDARISYINDFEPIPLTEEWLVSFGLKLKPNHTAFHIKGMQFEIPSMIGGYYDNEYGLDKETVIELKHVHQLQNLYFALTGEELKIKK